MSDFTSYKVSMQSSGDVISSSHIFSPSPFTAIPSSQHNTRLAVTRSFHVAFSKGTTISDGPAFHKELRRHSEQMAFDFSVKRSN